MEGLALVNYGSGNFGSVLQAFRHLGVTVFEAATPKDLERADRIVLPGVGAFGAVMERLEATGFAAALKREALERAKPLLGICVGMQVLADFGTEFGRHAGLGLVPGQVTRMDGAEEAGLPVPQIGWNEVDALPDTQLFRGMDPCPSFYFVHSYHFEPANPAHRIATCDYGGAVTAAIRRERIFGVQFHPEKSQEDGLRLLANFAAWDGA